MLLIFLSALQIADDGITVDGKPIRVVSNRDPTQLPWKEMGVDLVIEGTGVFVDEAGAGKHLEAGAKKVIITAPGKGDIPTFVMGVNGDDYKHEYPIVSNASCTTNCMAPFVKVLNVRCQPPTPRRRLTFRADDFFNVRSMIPWLITWLNCKLGSVPSSPLSYRGRSVVDRKPSVSSTPSTRSDRI